MTLRVKGCSAMLNYYNDVYSIFINKCNSIATVYCKNKIVKITTCISTITLCCEYYDMSAVTTAIYYFDYSDYCKSVMVETKVISVTIYGYYYLVTTLL